MKVDYFIGNLSQMMYETVEIFVIIWQKEFASTSQKCMPKALGFNPKCNSDLDYWYS